MWVTYLGPVQPHYLQSQSIIIWPDSPFDVGSQFHMYVLYKQNRYTKSSPFYICNLCGFVEVCWHHTVLLIGWSGLIDYLRCLDGLPPPPPVNVCFLLKNTFNPNYPWGFRLPACTFQHIILAFKFLFVSGRQLFRRWYWPAIRIPLSPGRDLLFS
jgi:hypothetical protein